MMKQQLAAHQFVLFGVEATDKPGGLVEGSVQVVVDGVHARAGVDQSLDAIQISPQRREVQRRRAVVVPGVDVGSERDQSLQDVDFAGVGGVMERRVAEGVSKVDVCLEISSSVISLE